MAEQLSTFWCSSWLGQAAAWCKPLWEVTLCPGVCPACSGTRARSGYPLPHPLASVPVPPSISGTAVQATERGQVHIQELIQAKNSPLFCHIYTRILSCLSSTRLFPARPPPIEWAGVLWECTTRSRRAQCCSTAAPVAPTAQDTTTLHEQGQQSGERPPKHKTPTNHKAAVAKSGIPLELVPQSPAGTL